MTASVPVAVGSATPGQPPAPVTPRPGAGDAGRFAAGYVAGLASRVTDVGAGATRAGAGTAAPPGVSKATVQNYESGRTAPRFVTLQKLAAALGCEVAPRADDEAVA